MSKKFLRLDSPSICECEEKTLVDSNDMLCINDCCDDDAVKMVKAANLLRAPEIFNEQTDDYVLVIEDAVKTIQMNKATEVFLTIPTNEDVAFPVGLRLEIENLGAGRVVVKSADGVEIKSSNDARNLTSYSTAHIKQVAIDVWLLAGDIEPETAKFWINATGELEFKTRGPAGSGFWVDWGDNGYPERVQHTNPDIDVVTVHDYDMSGRKDIRIYGRLEEITKFQCADAIEGNISEFSKFHSLAFLYVSFTELVGDISSLAGLTDLYWLYVSEMPVTGDIVSLSSLTSLVYLAFSGSESTVYGDISNLSGLTSLHVLYGNYSNVVGDAGDLATLVNLTIMQFNSTVVGYSSTTLPPWSNCLIRFDWCAWTVSEVDNFLIDGEAAGGSNGAWNLAGNNAARSEASDAAKAALLGRGYAITVNE